MLRLSTLDIVAQAVTTLGRLGHPVSSRKQRDIFIGFLRTVGDGPECITWRWSRSTTKYASTVNAEGKQVSAHRYVYEEIVGPLNGLHALHRCDNPPCVRPSHLFAGSHSDNMRDAYQKGRKVATRHAPPGEAHPNARLKAADVYAIRRLCAQGVSQGKIAATYGVSRACVTRINRRTLWKSLPEEA